MAQNSKIEWTGATWNPLLGCSKVSAGCANCYAIRQAHRLGANPATPQYHGLTQITNGKPNWTGKVVLNEKALELPLRWRKPRKIFVNSMSDLFHEAVPDEWIDRIFAVMALCPQHTFQVLTKRPGRMKKWFESSAVTWEKEGCPDLPGERKDDVIGAGFAMFQNKGRFSDADLLAFQDKWPLANVWLGVSAEDQKTADERIPLLLQTPAAVRWVSYEPALGPVNLKTIIPAYPTQIYQRLDWVVCGGESGPGARPMHPDWARSARDVCQMCGVPFFFKQWGEWIPCESNKPSQLPKNHGLRENSIGPEQLRWMLSDGSIVPIGNGLKEQGHILVTCVGKKAAGALLDGREWREYPQGNGRTAPWM